MRALLAHNRHARDDTSIAGFLWANEPEMTPPPAQKDDWWLCLPTKFDGDGLPTGGGANDLTTGDGRRVLEVAGLRIRVGSSEDVGTRPKPGDLNELTVEHSSGTKVTIASDGTVSVKASAKSSGISLSDGQVELTVSKGKVNVGQPSGGA
jgi:hypothetical protein